MKRMKTTLLLAAVSLGMVATPALAQKSAATGGTYWNVQDIFIEPGHAEQYLDFLKAKFQSECAWSMSKGYLVGCKVLGNVNKRMHEPDLFLIRMFKDMPTVAEQERRDAEYSAFVKMDDHQMDAEGASRTPIRKLGDNTLLQELVFSK
jgi:hypothetical protein